MSAKKPTDGKRPVANAIDAIKLMEIEDQFYNAQRIEKREKKEAEMAAIMGLLDLPEVLTLENIDALAINTRAIQYRIQALKRSFQLERDGIKPGIRIWNRCTGEELTVRKISPASATTVLDRKGPGRRPLSHTRILRPRGTTERFVPIPDDNENENPPQAHSP